MSYEAVDDVIGAWAKRHGLRLSTEFGGQPRRFCYVSGGKHECFQVSVDPPEGEHITVNAHDVETVDDAEFHWQRRVVASDLAPALEAALNQIAVWSRRHT
jgi:hypothetical protein